MSEQISDERLDKMIDAQTARIAGATFNGTLFMIPENEELRAALRELQQLRRSASPPVAQREEPEQPRYERMPADQSAEVRRTAAEWQPAANQPDDPKEMHAQGLEFVRRISGKLQQEEAPSILVQPAAQPKADT